MPLLIISFAIWFFNIRKKKFYPPKAKFYWGLAIMFLTVEGWIAFYSYGKKEHILEGEVFDYSENLPLKGRL